MFLGFIVFYVVSSGTARIIGYIIIDVAKSKEDPEKSWFLFETFALIFTSTINILIMIPIV